MPVLFSLGIWNLHDTFLFMEIHTVQDASVMRVLYGKGLTKLLYLAYMIFGSHEQVSSFVNFGVTVN